VAEQLVEDPSDAVVAERLWRSAIEAERRGLEAGRPFAEVIEGLAPSATLATSTPIAWAGGIGQRESGSGS